MTETISLTNFFSLPLAEQHKIIQEAIVDDTPITEPHGEPCQTCKGTGCCKECEGDGQVNHECDCEHCTVMYDPCGYCDGTGECQDCKGSGYKFLEAVQ